MHLTTQTLLVLSSSAFIQTVVSSPLLGSEQYVTSDPVENAPFWMEEPMHSQCYNYFLKKDNCVFSAANDTQRCPADGECGHDVPHHLPMVLKPKHHSSKRSSGNSYTDNSVGGDSSTHNSQKKSSLIDLNLLNNNKGGIINGLVRRDEDGFPPLDLSNVASGSLVRRYDSEDVSFPVAGGDGICGTYDDSQPGVCLWASASTNVTDASGGWLNSNFTKACGRQIFIMRKGNPDTVVYAPVVDGCDFHESEPQPGCFRIAFTNATFHALNPTPEEAKDGKMVGLTWDFNNIYGNKTENASV